MLNIRSNEIRLSGIISESIVDGPGYRYVIFTQGCPHHCEGCHNPETHDFDGGYAKNMDELVNDINSTKYLSGITFSGGEPFMQPDKCHYIASQIKAGYNKIAFTGFLYEDLLELGKKNPAIIDFLNDLDYLIDGPFVLSKRSLALKYKGSTNQRIIDLKKTRETGQIVIKEF